MNGLKILIPYAFFKIQIRFVLVLSRSMQQITFLESGCKLVLHKFQAPPPPWK